MKRIALSNDYHSSENSPFGERVPFYNAIPFDFVCCMILYHHDESEEWMKKPINISFIGL